MFHIHNLKDEKPSELEIKLDAKFVNKDREPYPSHIGKCVEIYTGNCSMYGIYQGLNDRGSLVLYPSLICEQTPRTAEKSNSTKYFWNSELPSLIHPRAVSLIRSARKEHIDECVIGKEIL